MEEPSFEQVINEHLELKKQHAELATAPAPEHEEVAPEDEDETEGTPAKAESDDFWASARDFDWGD